MYKNFQEYLDMKAGKKPTLVEKPQVEEVPDYHGEPNPYQDSKPKKLKNVKDGQVIEVTKFMEYLDSQGKVKNPKVTINVKDFPKCDAPPAQSMPPSKTQKGSPAPYVAKGKKSSGSEKGFADMAGADPPYEPETEKAPKAQASLKDIKDGQPQAESFRGMSLAEATHYIAEQNKLVREDCGACQIPMVTSYVAGKFMPDPLEAIEYIAHLAASNSNLMEALIRAVKRKDGGMKGMVGGMMGQPESFSEIVNNFEDDTNGRQHAGSFARAMNDSYSKYMDEFSAVNESALSPPVGFDDEFEDPDKDDEEEPSEDDDFGLDDESDEESDEQPEGEEGTEPEDMGGDGEGFEDLPKEEEPKAKKPKKTFAHNNLIDAMGGHKQMLDSMTEHCKKCGAM